MAVDGRTDSAGLGRVLASPALVGLVRWLLAIVFLLAAVPKLWRLEDFAMAVHNYRMLPPVLVGPAAVALPGIEALAALGLLTRRWRAASACIVVGLCAAFLVGVAAALVRGLNIECGCFSMLSERRVGYGLLAQDAVLFALACYCALALWPRAEGQAG